MTWVRSSHHVFSVKHLLSKLRYSNCPVARRTARRERGKSDHEEVQSREWDHIDGKFSEIRVQLTRETETRSDAGHNDGHEVVEVTISR